MAEHAETKSVDEPKEQETVNEALMKGDDDDAVQTLRALRDLKIDQETAKLKNQEPLPVSGFLIKTPISVESAQTSEEAAWMTAVKDLPPEGQKLVSLLRSLPVSSSDSDDAVVVYEILSLVIQFSYIRPLFEHKWGINQVLNPTTIQRSCSDDTLQALMAAFVLCISLFDNNERKILVHDCPGAMPFLLACLRSQTAETSRFAASALSWLSSEESNRKKMGELGAIERLIELIRQGGVDEACLFRAARATFNLCKVVENRERAVSEGAVIALMDKIRSRVCVDEMLKTLETLSRDEKAIAQLEEDGMRMLQELFVVLREEDKECCMTIIHTACGASVAKTRELINGAKNGRKTLDRVVSNGTTKAREKASELLLKLD